MYVDKIKENISLEDFWISFVGLDEYLLSLQETNV